MVIPWCRTASHDDPPGRTLHGSAWTMGSRHRRFGRWKFWPVSGAVAVPTSKGVGWTREVKPWRANNKMTHRESHGKSGFPLGNIVDFLETENMFSIAGPRTSWWSGAKRLVVVSLGAVSTKPCTRRSGTEPQESWRKVCTSDSSFLIHKLILDGTALSQWLQEQTALRQPFNTWRLNYCKFTKTWSGPTMLPIYKPFGRLKRIYIYNTHITYQHLGCLAAQGGKYDLPNELSYCFITILWNGRLGENDLVTFPGRCLQDMSAIKPCRHFYCQHEAVCHSPLEGKVRRLSKKVMECALPLLSSISCFTRQRDCGVALVRDCPC